MNFEVGQKVVAIRNHSQGSFKEGQIFTVTGVMRGCCKNNRGLISIGIKNNHTLINECQYCHFQIFVKHGEEFYYGHDSFAPLDTWQEAEEAVNELNQTIEI